MSLPSARSALVLLIACAAGGLLWGDDYTDQQIEQAAARSWVLHDQFGGRINVTAKDGVATVTGRVDNADQKELVETTVDLIPNVNAIDDQVRVGGPAVVRSDGWILLHLKAELLMRRDVSAAGTRVAVHDGEVILSGSAPSTAQKELTEQYARGVEGVVAVLNDMTAGEPPSRARTAATFVGDDSGPRHAWDDPSITAQVRYELLQLHIHYTPRLRVVTRSGIVTLTGLAYNQDEKELIGRAAESAPGVRQVVDLLRVRGQ